MGRLVADSQRVLWSKSISSWAMREWVTSTLDKQVFSGRRSHLKWEEGAEVFCWQGVSSLLLSWCLLTTPIYHLFDTSVKLASCILQQSSDVPVSPESINCLPLHILLTLHPFLLPINDLSFASWNNEVLWPIMWNYRCSLGALCHRLPSLLKQ